MGYNNQKQVYQKDRLWRKREKIYLIEFLFSFFDFFHTLT